MDEFVSISEAARIAGVNCSVIYRLIGEGMLRTYTTPLNRRVTLIRRTDLAALMTPTPIEGEPQKSGQPD